LNGKSWNQTRVTWDEVFLLRRWWILCWGRFGELG
jgi:hypothetical protein